jgi:hypothetical protein
MADVCNLSPLHRPPTPSLDRGPVQRRVCRAFIAMDKPVLSTSQIVEWTHPRPGTDPVFQAMLENATRICEAGSALSGSLRATHLRRSLKN